MTSKYLQERQRLIAQIEEWNSNRLDLFALSQPNENLEFFGVMRFFYQDEGEKVSTKCIRVANTAKTRDVMATLIEKFRPDMRMLSPAQYALYEVHVNGEERQLQGDEYPLIVQLNWGKDDREGRFLLKKEAVKTALLQLGEFSLSGSAPTTADDKSTKGNTADPSFNRKLSKREKKELKKKEKEQQKLSEATSTVTESSNSVAKKLYNELPESSFTRSISNPELVMRKRRELKLEKKLLEIRSKDGGPDSGGTLKIYGGSINPDVPYKTLLLSVTDNAAHVVRETLDKYGLEKEDPFNYCLVQVLMPPGGSEDNKLTKECLLNDDDCPLAILLQHPPSKGTVVFQLRKKTDAQKRLSQRRSGSYNDLRQGDVRQPDYRQPDMRPAEIRQPDWRQPDVRQPDMRPAEIRQPDWRQPDVRQPDMRPAEVRQPDWRQPDGRQVAVHLPPPAKAPFLMEVTADGRDVVNGRRFELVQNVTEVGSENPVRPSTQYIQLLGMDIVAHHCILSLTQSSVTVTPLSSNAAVFINGVRILQTTILCHGDYIVFGRSHNFVFIDPAVTELQQRKPKLPPVPEPVPVPKLKSQNSDFETTFDVDGHVETVVASKANLPQGPDSRFGHPGYEPDLLPATLTFKEEGEDHFLSAVINDVNGAAIQFRLAPAYTIYMSLRSRVSRPTRPDLSVLERDKSVNSFANKVVWHISQLVQDSKSDPGSLSFWLANASELLHFMKQDIDVGRCTTAAQGQLADTIQMTFTLLIDCFQSELATYMPVFLNPATDDVADMSSQSKMNSPSVGNVIQLLSTAMTLLRRCRVNAALTIQLFSQLFHFINAWLFNRVVLEPRLQLCTREWGNILRKRLAHVQIWAEKQGLELAADCHLAKVVQMAILLESPKTPYELMSLLPSCDSLNSLQLRALLCNYISAPNEVPLSRDVINQVVNDAANHIDRQLLAEGRTVTVHEAFELLLPFLLPEDGYSCDYVKGMPPGLAEFIDSCVTTGVCRLTCNPNSCGLWTVYMGESEDSPTYQNLKAVNIEQQLANTKPEVVTVAFNKVNNSLGLSIVAAKGENQAERAIYIKSVVSGGAADLDGRLQGGDLLLEVDGQSLAGVTQEVAAKMMSRAGPYVTLKVAKQGAVYHGLAQLLSQSSPPPNRGGLNKQTMANNSFDGKMRTKSEDLTHYEHEQQLNASMGTGARANDGIRNGRPLLYQHEAKSTPALSAFSTNDPRNPQQPAQKIVTHAPAGGQLTSSLKTQPDLSSAPSAVGNERPFATSPMPDGRPQSELFVTSPLAAPSSSMYPPGAYRSVDSVLPTDYLSLSEKPFSRPAAVQRQPGYAAQMLFPNNQPTKSNQQQQQQPVATESPVSRRHASDNEPPQYKPSAVSSASTNSGSSTMLPSVDVAPVVVSSSVVHPNPDVVLYVDPRQTSGAVDAPSSVVEPSSAVAKEKLVVLTREPGRNRPADTVVQPYRRELSSLSTDESSDSIENDFPPPPPDMLLQQLGSANRDKVRLPTVMSIEPGSLHQPPSKKQPPPIAAKPKIAAPPASMSSSLSSSDAPSARDSVVQLPDEEKMKKRSEEIRRLESRPYLTTNEQIKLQRLREEAELDKRLLDEYDRDRAISEPMSQMALRQSHSDMDGKRLLNSSDEGFARVPRSQQSIDLTTATTEVMPARPPLPVMLTTSYSPRNVSSPSQQYSQGGTDRQDGEQFGSSSSISALNDTGTPADVDSGAKGVDRSGAAAAEASNAQTDTPSVGSQPFVQRSNEQKNLPGGYDVGQTTSSGSNDVTLKPRNAGGVSALKQATTAPTTGTAKKSVTFNENMVTEYAFNRSYGSTSSESSFAPPSPAEPPDDVETSERNGLPGVELLYGSSQNSYPYQGGSAPQYYTPSGSAIPYYMPSYPAKQYGAGASSRENDKTEDGQMRQTSVRQVQLQQQQK